MPQSRTISRNCQISSQNILASIIQKRFERNTVMSASENVSFINNVFFSVLGEEELESRFSGNNAVQILKCLPTKSNVNICALSGQMEEAVTVLLDALIVKVQYDEDPAAQTNPTATNSGEAMQNMADINIQRRTNPENMPHMSRNSSANDLLQQDDEDIVCLTRNSYFAVN